MGIIKFNDFVSECDENDNWKDEIHWKLSDAIK